MSTSKISSTRSRRLVRSLLQGLQPYVPGEQPKIRGLIKLNTNENPYPPSPKVLRAIKAAVDGRLRLYPNPTAQPLREKLAKMHRCKPENIIVGNGSDELLAMAVRAFVEPGEAVQYFAPSYSLYPVLADIHGARRNPVALQPDFSLPSMTDLKARRQWDFHAPLTFITTPNAPSGRAYRTEQLETLCRAQEGAVILDEAYVDFARENAMRLALKYPHVLVARTFSKAYSLCFQRIGYLAGHPELVTALDKIRDSYNVNGLGQIAAVATLDDLPYYRSNFRKIIAAREELSRELGELGFHIFPSQTNFILARPPKFSPQDWLRELRERKILVRWFNYPFTRNYLRITVGTARETAALARAAREILKLSLGLSVAAV